MSGSFSEMALFFERMETRLDAKLAAKDAAIAEERKELAAKMAELTTPTPEVISDQELASFQSRLESLHAGKLLTNEVRGFLTWLSYPQVYHGADVLTDVVGAVRNRRYGS